MINDQKGKFPSDPFPKRIGRLIDGWEATATKKDTRDAYKNGIESRLNLSIRRERKNMKKVAHFKPMRTDKPTPIVSSAIGIEVLSLNNQETSKMKPQRERVDQKSRFGIVLKNIQVGNNGGVHRFWLWRENGGEVWGNSKNGINPELKLDF